MLAFSLRPPTFYMLVYLSEWKTIHDTTRACHLILYVLSDFCPSQYNVHSRPANDYWGKIPRSTPANPLCSGQIWEKELICCEFSLQKFPQIFMKISCQIQYFGDRNRFLHLFPLDNGTFLGQMMSECNVCWCFEPNLPCVVWGTFPPKISPGLTPSFHLIFCLPSSPLLDWTMAIITPYLIKAKKLELSRSQP